MAQFRTNNKKTFNSFFKITALSLLVVFLIAGSVLAYMGYKMASVTSSAQQELDRGDRSDLRETVVNPSNDPISILFLGLDSRDGDLTGRTDAMILTTFNPEEGTIKMLNIPRDSRVEIVGRGFMDKINHAHAFGGVDMTIDTVENLFDIPVDYFVSLNFDAFMEIIDELGGVTVNVPFTFTEKDNATYGTIVLEEGEHRLNGQEALAYVRMRKQDPQGDLGRGERQKEVIEAIIKEAVSLSSITRFGSVMDSVGNNLNTNITFNNMLSMHSYANKLGNIESLKLDGRNYIEEGIYYYKLEEESVAEITQTLQLHLNIISEEDIQVPEEEFYSQNSVTN
ncbi:LCP family protein [Evansella sp. AB-P1]|uniref:LCP family glycopolymer transferase n=1 Tax=Evansella sp. AB-P1 TaxID=3037653 RepID=UPI00241D376E|nr:LCP family protein [Evansella sp. AB-P1]MDG5786690.1 LCP family protein [Evansella sp. AB-P1]